LKRRSNVFPVRYELKLYVSFRRNLVFNGSTEFLLQLLLLLLILMMMMIMSFVFTLSVSEI
jgi:hypothetical protein